MVPERMVRKARQGITSIIAGLMLCGLMNITSMCLAAGDKWEEKADMAIARNCIAASTVNEKIYVIGGYTNDNGGYRVLSDVAEYDPATDTWEEKANMPTARARLSTSVVDGKIYAFGGTMNDSTVLATVEEYDPAADTWRKKTDIPTPMSGMSTSVVDGKIYVIGGHDRARQMPYSTVYQYDPMTDTWTKKADMPMARGNLSTAVFEGEIYAFGGWDFRVQLDTVEVYDPMTDRWSDRGTMPVPNSIFGAAAANGRIYLIGGDRGVALPGLALSRVDIYHPINDNWSEGTPMPTRRRNIGVSEFNGRIYVFGGENEVGGVQRLSAVEEYTPAPRLAVSSRGKLAATWGNIKQR